MRIGERWRVVDEYLIDLGDAVANTDDDYDGGRVDDDVDDDDDDDDDGGDDFGGGAGHDDAAHEWVILEDEVERLLLCVELRDVRRHAQEHLERNLRDHIRSLAEVRAAAEGGASEELVNQAEADVVAPEMRERREEKEREIEIEIDR